ncbi:MAG: hypothetical protein Q8O68_00340 [Candidatus Daviesbacteria bacterium]|nr:hypothetical protein [Candidatus Daviesbacteria bacterium]
MTYIERKEKIQSDAQDLIKAVDTYSLEAAKGSHESAVSLIYTLVPHGPDEGIRIPYNVEIAMFCSPYERLAIVEAKKIAGRFNRNFGWDCATDQYLNFGNRHLQALFRNTGQVVQGILHPDGEFGKDVVEHKVEVEEAFKGLINWAETVLTNNSSVNH